MVDRINFLKNKEYLKIKFLVISSGVRNWNDIYFVLALLLRKCIQQAIENQVLTYQCATINPLKSRFLKRHSILQYQTQQTIISLSMQENLHIITQFGNTISVVIRRFAELCREHQKKMQDSKSEFEQLQAQLIRERKKRMELEVIIRQRVNSNQNGSADPSLSEFATPQQERRKPKNAFTLFLADQRDKILKQHPTLDLSKITTLATIKWRKLSKDQQQVYENKLNQMNSNPENIITQQMQGQSKNDAALIKKQYVAQQQEERRQYHSDRQQQLNNHESQGQISRENQATIFNDEVLNQRAETDKVQLKQKGAIQKILDLFHTPNPTENKQMQNYSSNNKELSNNFENREQSQVFQFNSAQEDQKSQERDNA